MLDAKRCRRGEGHPQAKTSDRQVLLLRLLRKEVGASYGSLAAVFGLSKGAVAKICRHERRAGGSRWWAVLQGVWR